MDKLTEWVLGLAIGALAWFMKAKMNAYDEKHREHYRDIAELRTEAAAVSQQVEDHEKVDDERFTRIEAMFREMRANFVDVLKALNGRRA